MDSIDGTTMDVCNAILPRYADVVYVGSNDDGNRTPVINRGNIDGGLPTSTIACGTHEGVSDIGGERAATPVGAAVAGIGGAEAEALAGGNGI